jgi:hypothetical protein
MTATNAGEGHSDRTVMVWIENGEGSIARGLAEAVTSTGACVRLTETPAFDAGQDVALRICFERGAPTVALRARVRFVRNAQGAVECGLELIASAPQRATLEAWITSAA